MIIGIDPGKCGGAAVYYNGKVTLYSFKNKSEREIADAFDLLVADARCKIFGKIPEIKCYMEKVHSAPGQGVASMFTFGQHYGFIRGVMVSKGIPIIDVTPYEWQRALRIPTRNGKTYTEHKKLLREIATRLYPNLKPNAETADALLIMHYVLSKESNMDI